jgi:hypothetical protein
MHHLPVGLVAEYLVRLEPLSLESIIEDPQGTLCVFKHGETTLIVLARLESNIQALLPSPVTFTMKDDTFQGQLGKQTFEVVLLETVYAPKNSSYKLKPASAKEGQKAS